MGTIHNWSIRSLLIGSVMVVFLGMAMLLSTAWLKGDDYLMVCDEFFAMEKVYRSIHWFLNYNARLGELIVRLLGLDGNNKWQHWVITPMMLVILPFILVRLLCRKGTVSERRFLLFFWFACFLALQSVYMGKGGWRNFWCYAASVNYFWCSLITLFFFSLIVRSFRKTDKNGSKWECFAMFCVGCCSGWSSEAVSVVVIPLLLIAWLWCKLHQISVPKSCCYGVIGMVMGALLMFGSPGMHRRAAGEIATRQLDVYAMTPEQITEFVQNLTPEKVQLLKGASGIVSLAGIPMHQHVYFIPYLAERYWESCYLPSMVLLALAVVTILVRFQGWQRLLLWSMGIYLLSWVCACSYLGGCIPSQMSFLPPSYMVMVAAALLFLKLQGRHARLVLAIVTMVVVGIGLVRLVPAGVEAWQYKKYEKERFESIARQKAAGCDVIILPQPSWPVEPEDSLGLIRKMDFGPGVNDYPNGPARAYFKVQGIMKEKESENAH